MKMMWIHTRAHFKIVLCSLVVSAVAASMTARGSGEYTDIKSIALNPSEYLGKRVTLHGQVRAVSAGDAWFVLEDTSGKMLIASHQIGLPLYCGSGSTAAIEGQLSDLGAEYGLYFSMTALEMCNDQSHPVAATVASLLRRGFAWAF
jgi:hypothetical protein